MDKILRGARPADLPVAERTKFELWINLKTAQKLGITIASLLRYRMPFPDSFVATTDASERAELRRDVGPYGEAVSRYLAAEVLRFAALPAPTPGAAVDEYMRAYEADPRFMPAVGKILESAVQDPQTAQDLVLRVSRVHPDQPDISRLRERLVGADSPEAVRDVILRFLATGGD